MTLLRIFGSEYSFFPSEIAYALSGLLATIAAVLIFPNVRSSAKIQVGTLVVIGLLLMIYANLQGESIDLIQAISRNTLLLTMILSVGFLKLLLDLDSGEDALPRGRKAHLNTLINLGFFGSIINISAPIMICDRISQERPVDLFATGAITRVFGACSCWSPYFAGTALILTLVPDVSLLVVMLTGFPMLLIMIFTTHTAAVIRHKDKINNFIGYPVALSKLWIPILLTFLVVATNAVNPALPILVVISLSALVITAVMLFFKSGLTQSLAQLKSHTTTGLAKSANELLLFMAAGILASGISAFLNSTDFQISLSHYTVQAASIMLAAMLLIAAMGIHPVIQVSVLTPLLLPIDPNPELLAMTFLFSWGLGIAASPLGGTHLVIQGRYGISAWQGAKQNWPYIIPMYFVAVFLLAGQSYFSS